MKYRPDDAELLDAIAATLEQEVMPAVPPAVQHRVRVASNLVRILQRQQALEPAAVERELDLLSELLGHATSPPGAGAAPPGRPDPRSAVVELRAELDGRLRAGDPSLEPARVWDVLVEICRLDLAAAKPGYDSWAGP
ncbi:MAG TPA: DUF6285 domain-containing protein [Acidimicrobiales bacterium]|nr:DUF6285 domain-containing protein [Acidimicrobiales bacterium]